MTMEQAGLVSSLACTTTDKDSDRLPPANYRLSTTVRSRYGEGLQDLRRETKHKPRLRRQAASRRSGQRVGAPLQSPPCTILWTSKQLPARAFQLSFAARHAPLAPVVSGHKSSPVPSSRQKLITDAAHNHNDDMNPSLRHAASVDDEDDEDDGNHQNSPTPPLALSQGKQSSPLVPPELAPPSRCIA